MLQKIKFVTITILLKELMILLKWRNCNFIKQIAKISTHIYNNIKKKNLGGGGGPLIPQSNHGSIHGYDPPPPFGGPLMVPSQDMYILNVFARKLEPKTSRSNCNILDYEFIMRWGVLNLTSSIYQVNQGYIKDREKF